MTQRKDNKARKHDEPQEPGIEVRYLQRCEHQVVLERKHPSGTQIIHARQLAEGQPIPHGHDLAHVVPDTSSRTGYRMHVVHKHAGPARASTPAYRDGYDAIFGKKVSRGEA